MPLYAKPMNTKIDMRSALVGLCAGVLVTLAIGAASSGPGAVGRYQIGGTSTHAIILDTANGETWFKHFPAHAGYTSPDFEKPKTGAK